ncbi:MAG: hypothetical protein IJD99_01110 [Clostridia bacterium]|nr:hypothetical protein [Clostridia bacterium]
MAENRKPCRCLLFEAGQADMARTVAEYVASLDETIRTPEDAYRARLALCQECPELMNGTCRLCGCYVETRAAKRGQKCPMVPARWSKIEE